MADARTYGKKMGVTPISTDGGNPTQVIKALREENAVLRKRAELDAKSLKDMENDSNVMTNTMMELKEDLDRVNDELEKANNELDSLKAEMSIVSTERLTLKQKVTELEAVIEAAKERAKQAKASKK